MAETYYVSRAFKIDPSLPMTATAGGLAEFMHLTSEEASRCIFIEKITKSLVVIDPGTNPVELYLNFLDFVDLLSIKEDKVVRPGLYDAGYIPFTISPKIMFSSIDIAEVQAKLTDFASALGIHVPAKSAKYFEDSMTLQSDTIRWIKRSDAAKILHLPEDASSDSITTKQLISSIIKEVV